MKYLFYALIAVLLLSSCKDSPLFQQIPSSYSGIKFNNIITENDSVNAIDNAYVYNGGGVGIGDFNNDGLQDIYFTGNMVSNRLYLNLGNFKFKDITAEAGLNSTGKWGKGVSIIDINNDGLMDIYVCNSNYSDSSRRCNYLYINQGTDKKGIVRFTEMAGEYGLDIKEYSTIASFFDYNNDGTLDMYLTVNRPETAIYPNMFRPIIKDGSGNSSGKLYRNEWDSKQRHPVFHNVSMEAGIKVEGYGHAATIVDINRDGWKDIYVTNDFLSANILYINNHDGTFTDRSKEYFKHTSFNAMGQSVVDINNDGLADIIELDMNPEDNFRKKMMQSANSYQLTQNFDFYGYQYQYVRNTLQLNQGLRILPDGSLGSPVFSEIAFMSGIAQTDWSWTPVVTDFDNDGFRDIVITNGYPKDVTDHDFMTYRQNAFAVTSKKHILEKIPSVKIHNYAFQNNGGLIFNNVTAKWGLSDPDFSNGAVYADLNNDGAMDMIINNINDEALIYKNTSLSKDTANTHFIQIKFKGDKNNLNGLGAWAYIYYNNDKHQIYENNPYNGYLSTNENIAHFGLGKIRMLDSVVICWPNGTKQRLNNIRADQRITVSVVNAKERYSWNVVNTSKPLFKEVTQKKDVKYNHKESGFIDFNIQKLLPHKLSGYSPALAAGDIDGNGLDDIAIGGDEENIAQVLLQQTNGKFIQRDLLTTDKNRAGRSKDEGILLFDADQDGTLDMYIVSGGYKDASGSEAYQDRFYINNGKGNFTLQKNALPTNLTSKLCVRASDYNKDGKIDLFVSGRVDPWHYPKAVSSFIFRNDSNQGQVKFTDVTGEVAPALKNIGLVCDALFTDYDNDGWADLILAGEWMPVTILKNINGKYVNVTGKLGLAGKFGWWNSIAAGDFRHTGRQDYIIGNAGLNTLYQASDKCPVGITAKDFDKRDRFDAFTSLYLLGRDGIKHAYPMNVRDDAFKQMISLRTRFTNYRSYADATMEDMFTRDQIKGAVRLKANELRSCYIRNDGDGKFTMIPLPLQAQTAPLNGMVADDFDGDGNLDVAINGNDFGTEVSIGRYDALNGLILKGNGMGSFKPLSILQSGIYLPGDGKSLVKLVGNNGSYLLASSENNGPVKVFELKRKGNPVSVESDDQSVTIRYKNGSVQKQELYYGTSFLSQSSRFIYTDNNMLDLTIIKNNGKKRTVNLTVPH